MDYKQIVWLASYPKSGNTWLRCFLDAYLMGEVDINNILCSVQDDIAAAHQIGDGGDVTKLPIDIQQLTRPMALLRQVRAYNEMNPVTPLFMKSHSPNYIANGIELFPPALTKKIVYIVRDPRDVVISFAKHMGTDLDIGVKWMNDKYRTLTSTDIRTADFLGAWDAHVLSFLNDDIRDVLIIKFEDIRANPVQEFTKVIQHVGLELDHAKVRKSVELTALDRLKNQEEEKGFKESSPHAKDKFFGKGEIGGWKGKLTQKQRYRLEKDLGSMMKRLGYLKRKVA